MICASLSLLTVNMTYTRINAPPNLSITIHIWLLLLLIYGTRTDWLRLPLKKLQLWRDRDRKRGREREGDREISLAVHQKRQSSSFAAKVNKFTPSHLKISKQTTQMSRGSVRAGRGEEREGEICLLCIRLRDRGR